MRDIESPTDLAVESNSRDAEVDSPSADASGSCAKCDGAIRADKRILFSRRAGAWQGGEFANAPPSDRGNLRGRSRVEALDRDRWAGGSLQEFTPNLDDGSKELYSEAAGSS